MSSRPILIDDHILASFLGGTTPFRTRRPLATTGLWYHRLARALATSQISGSLSRAFGRSDSPLGTAAVRSAIALPEHIGLVSLRELASPMADLVRDGARLNLLSLEAVAAAEHLGADIYLGADNVGQALVDLATSRGVAVRIVGPDGRPSPPAPAE